MAAARDLTIEKTSMVAGVAFEKGSMAAGMALEKGSQAAGYVSSWLGWGSSSGSNAEAGNQAAAASEEQM